MTPSSDWRAHKRAVEEFILTRLERLIPGIIDRMVVRLSATAATHHRYTLNHHGAMLGWEMSPDQLSPSRPDVAGLARGFYLVGHWSRPGGGITPVMVSAMEVARRAVAELESSSSVDAGEADLASAELRGASV